MKNGMNDLKSTGTITKQSYLVVNKALHIANVMVSFVIFKLRDLVSLKDNDKKA